MGGGLGRGCMITVMVYPFPNPSRKGRGIMEIIIFYCRIKVKEKNCIFSKKKI
jgi:hypothetical protein